MYSTGNYIQDPLINHNGKATKYHSRDLDLIINHL